MAISAVNTRNPGMEVGGMLEKIHVPPAVLGGVIGITQNPAYRTGKLAPTLKIDMDVETLLDSRKENLFNLPRQFQPEGGGKKFLLVHVTSKMNIGTINDTLPTQNSEEPYFHTPSPDRIAEQNEAEPISQCGS